MLQNTCSLGPFLSYDENKVLLNTVPGDVITTIHDSKIGPISQRVYHWQPFSQKINLSVQEKLHYQKSLMQVES